jgi:hypothetical protein
MSTKVAASGEEKDLIMEIEGRTKCASIKIVSATEELFCRIKVRKLVCPWRIFARIEAGTSSDMRSTSLGEC